MPSVFLPGEQVTPLTSRQTYNVSGGLQRKDKALVATRAGVLCSPGNTNRLETNRKRYVPKLEDPVIGVVVRRTPEAYQVDIGAAHLALLDGLSFDGASKRNRPSLAVGTLIYARVCACSKDMDPEITCCASVGHQRKDWVTGLGVFGELHGGYSHPIPSLLALRFLQETVPLLSKLGATIPFEAAIGVNGHLWVSSKCATSTIVVVNLLLRSATAPEHELRKLMSHLADLKL
eukprot:NODE_4564_length_769_cov_65.429907_g4405_i0.p1 GENE.NODE_4564_length_769_cov_65.429907_g4405_i0~~NODE_4564_length_769_cov_65.429907_g4405_i0.p1  ORF type:complete len:233 (-),score=55.69 NODE_4564_length_769_cov_65.429907_g4405_i0:22-720(-)